MVTNLLNGADGIISVLELHTTTYEGECIGTRAYTSVLLVEQEKDKRTVNINKVKKQ